MINDDTSPFVIAKIQTLEILWRRIRFRATVQCRIQPKEIKRANGSRSLVQVVAKSSGLNYKHKMTLPHMPVAVIFDMDGLIFDTETLYQQAFLAAAAVGGHDLPTAVIHRTIGVPWTQSRILILEQMGSAFPVDQYFEQMTEHFELLAATQLRLKPGVVELLDVLDQLEMPRCIATSSAHSTVQSHLSAHGLADRFHAVIGHGDYVASKPSPDPFLTAAKCLGVDPALCLALEDSYNGVRSASAAGMMTFMVPDLLSPTPEIQSLCTGVVSDLHAVRKLILTASAADIAG
ncbi:HAD family hydrolase [Rhizobium sp. 2YAF20]|uniref:HAD family hydrolase n=1 Tax=Rhizobium sp. 2YAF20 TaxID=3233027 RepID=UPI003F9A83B0